MTRALFVLGAVRAVIDLVDAADELAHRFGIDPAGVTGQVGEWDLDATLALSRFGLGVMWEHDAPLSPTWPDVTVLALHVGPLTVTACRERTWQPARDPAPVALDDCSLGGPLGDVGDPLPGYLEAAAGDPREPELEALELERTGSA